VSRKTSEVENLQWVKQTNIVTPPKQVPGTLLRIKMLSRKEESVNTPIALSAEN